MWQGSKGRSPAPDEVRVTVVQKKQGKGRFALRRLQRSRHLMGHAGQRLTAVPVCVLPAWSCVWRSAQRREE